MFNFKQIQTSVLVTILGLNLVTINLLLASDTVESTKTTPTTTTAADFQSDDLAKKLGEVFAGLGLEQDENKSGEMAEGLLQNSGNSNDILMQVYALMQKATRAEMNKKLELFPVEIKKQITDSQEIYNQVTELILIQNAHNKLIDDALNIVRGLNMPTNTCPKQTELQLEKLKAIVEATSKNPLAQKTNGPLGLSLQTLPLQSYEVKDATVLQEQLKELLPLIKSNGNAYEKISCLYDLVTALINKDATKIFVSTVKYITPQIENAKTVLNATLNNIETWYSTLPKENKNLADGASKWRDDIKKTYSIVSNLLSISSNANISQSKFSKKLYEKFLFTYDLFQKFYTVHNYHMTKDPHDRGSLRVALSGFALERAFDGLNFINHQSDDYAQRLYGMMFERQPVEMVANSEMLHATNIIMGFYLIAGIFQQTGNGTKPHSLGANLVNYLHIDPSRSDLVESSIDVFVALVYYQFSCLVEKKEPKAWPSDFAPLNKAVRDLIFTIKSHITSEIASHFYKNASPESIERFEKFSMGILKPELAYIFVDFFLQWLLSKNYIPGVKFTPGQVCEDAAFESLDKLDGTKISVADIRLGLLNDSTWNEWLWSYVSPTRFFKPALSSQYKYEWVSRHLKAKCDPLGLYMRWTLEAYMLKSIGEFWGTKLGRRFNGPVSRVASWVACKIGHLENTEDLTNGIKQFKDEFLMTLSFINSDMFRPTIAPLLMQLGLIAAKSPDEVDSDEFQRAFVKLILQVASNSKYKIISPKDAARSMITFDKTHDIEAVVDQLGEVIKSNTVGFAFGKITGYIASSAPIVSYVDGKAEKLFTQAAPAA